MNAHPIRPTPKLDQILVTPRTYEEYRSIFGLSESDLSSGPILDCPGGASDFGLTVRSSGGRCVSVDCRYDLSPADFAKLFDAEWVRMRAWASAQPDRFRFLRNDGSDHWERWRIGAEKFLADYEKSESEGQGNYVAAALPQLPFEDGSFSLVLSGFLLFTYVDRFDFEFHIAAVTELLRVCRGEVRLHPLNEITGRSYPHLNRLIEHFRQSGFGIRVQPAHSEIDEGDDQTLVLIAGRDDG
ncbi:class I SAM-dependent methyltransferase [Nocardia vaccinii]|uniref:class I SAM-dependent methyltransferase n=1 Tax=Nocardia vaccinii TaxID=1822 RepID=UPI0012F4C8A8|nr:class I SAM-dependent methyltransferase [Nocardia vaccinii]